MDEKSKRFWIAFTVAIIVVIVISYWDIMSMRSNVVASSPSEYTNGHFISGWGTLFYSFADFLILLVPICYFLFYRRDFSKAIAIFITSKICLMFGVADVFYFWLQGKMIPATLPWLTPHTHIGWFTNYSGVTNISLLISAGVGIIISLGIAYFLKEKL